MEKIETIIEKIENKNIKHIAFKVKDNTTKEKLVNFILDNCKLICGYLEYFNIEERDILLVDLSNRGENGRGLGEDGNGTLTINDVKNAILTIASAIDVENQEQAFNRFIFLSCNIHGFFITNKDLPIKEHFNNNPVYQSICPMANVILNEDLEVVDVEYIVDFKNDEDLLVEDENRINLR